MSWLDDLLEATKEAESPPKFIYWSGLCAISAVLKKRVFINKHYYKLYPNVYVMLIAKSGGRKGFPIKLARKMVQVVNNTRIISGRNSIQAVLKELSTTQTRKDGTIIDKAHSFIVSPEFTNLIIDEPGSLGILTELFDTHDNEPEWRNTLKSSGVETLKEPCITLLGASNPTHFHNRVSSIDVTGGFIGRTLLIIENDRGKINPLLDPPENTFDPTKLAEYLYEVAKLEGEFEFTPEGKLFYEDWYKEFRSRTIDDETGTVDRLHDHILKIAMLVSIARSPRLVITKADLEDSMTLCNKIVGNVKRMTGGEGKSQLGKQTKLVLNEMLSADNNKISRKRLLSKYYGEFDAYDLDRIIETLTQMKAVTCRSEGKDIVYEMSKDLVSQFNDFLHGKDVKAASQ